MRLKLQEPNTIVNPAVEKAIRSDLVHHYDVPPAVGQERDRSLKGVQAVTVRVLYLDR